MKAKAIMLGIVLLAFLAESTYVVYEHGYLGFFKLAFANSVTGVMMFDLVIALSIFLVWMVGDARERGIGYGKYLLLTATFGSAGPLAYLLHREQQSKSPATRGQARRSQMAAGPRPLAESACRRRPAAVAALLHLIGRGRSQI